MKLHGLIIVGLFCLSSSAWAQVGVGVAHAWRAQHSPAGWNAPEARFQIVPNANECAPFLPEAVWGANSGQPIGYSCHRSSNGG
jgi:hypothetical protein